MEKTTQKALEATHEALAAQGPARPLVPANQLGLLRRKPLGEELRPVPEPRQQGRHPHQAVVPPGQVGRRTAPAVLARLRD